ncbi:hypothetical protein ACFO1B_53000 [Dactylosporangium siamense]|nr:hypothetical protein [Dactylosporangium siamense]
MHADWFPAISGGLSRAEVAPDDLSCAFYGDLFRPAGRMLGAAEPAETQVEDPFDVELLFAWWAEAALVDSAVVPPDARTLARTPRSVQAALNALANSRFFAAAYRRAPGVFDRLLVSDLQQVRRYMTEPSLRQEVRARVENAVTSETRVVVAHSLGSVAAYEALCAHPEWKVNTFITLGSPLGIRQLFFDRLDPSPRHSDSGELVGVWPGAVEHWTNLADDGDVVALVKDLRSRFGPKVVSIIVHNGAHAHDSSRYLSTVEVGAAIAAGLAAA